MLEETLENLETETPEATETTENAKLNFCRNFGSIMDKTRHALAKPTDIQISKEEVQTLSLAFSTVFTPGTIGGALNILQTMFGGLIAPQLPHGVTMPTFDDEDEPQPRIRCRRPQKTFQVLEGSLQDIAAQWNALTQSENVEVFSASQIQKLRGRFALMIEVFTYPTDEPTTNPPTPPTTPPTSETPNFSFGDVQFEPVTIELDETDELTLDHASEPTTAVDEPPLDQTSPEE